MFSRAKLLVTSLAFAACVPVDKPATPIEFAHLDECPNPVYESMAWALLNGTVIEVAGNNQFLLKSNDGRALTVTVANVGVNQSAEARTVLAELLVGKRVEVLFNPPDEEQAYSRVVGQVHVPGKGDVARFLLKAGEARFEPTPPYTLSTYSECLNRIAEREAREQRRGIWAGSAE